MPSQAATALAGSVLSSSAWPLFSGLVERKARSGSAVGYLYARDARDTPSKQPQQGALAPMNPAARARYAAPLVCSRNARHLAPSNARCLSSKLNKAGGQNLGDETDAFGAFWRREAARCSGSARSAFIRSSIRAAHWLEPGPGALFEQSRAVVSIKARAPAAGPTQVHTATLADRCDFNRRVPTDKDPGSNKSSNARRLVAAGVGRGQSKRWLALGPDPERASEMRASHTTSKGIKRQFTLA